MSAVFSSEALGKLSVSTSGEGSGPAGKIAGKHRLVNGMPDPRIPEPAPFTMTGRSSIPVGELSGAVVAAGYRPAYRSVIPYPRAFDDMGFPSQVDGASTELPGLFFIGTHFLRTRGSSLLMGVGEDAAIVAGQVSELVA